MFHPIDGLTMAETHADNVRVFEGDGTPFLRVPGLKSIESVRVGPVAIPLDIEMEIPADASLTRMNKMRVPMVDVQETADGERILLRSRLSNDGIWQAGVKIYVAGEWADESQEPAKKARKQPGEPDPNKQPE